MVISISESHVVPGRHTQSHPSWPQHGPKTGQRTAARSESDIATGAVLPKQLHHVTRLGRRCSNSEDVRPDPVSQVHHRSSGRTTVARESVDLLQPLRNTAAGSDRDFLREAVAVLGGSRQGPGEASTSAAPRPRRRDRGTTSCRGSSRTSRQRTPRIRTRNDWAWMRSCVPTRWYALESSRVEHADDCVFAEPRRTPRQKMGRSSTHKNVLPGVRQRGRLHRHLGTGSSISRGTVRSRREPSIRRGRS